MSLTLSVGPCLQEFWPRSPLQTGALPDELLMVPTLCPICRSATIEQILHETLLSAHRDGLRCSSSGVFAYHCNSGHVFLIVNDAFRWEEAVIDGTASLAIV